MEVRKIAKWVCAVQKYNMQLCQHTVVSNDSYFTRRFTLGVHAILFPHESKFQATANILPKYYNAFYPIHM